jgi:hypothetical protein
LLDDLGRPAKRGKAAAERDDMAVLDHQQPVMVQDRPAAVSIVAVRSTIRRDGQRHSEQLGDCGDGDHFGLLARDPRQADRAGEAVASMPSAAPAATGSARAWCAIRSGRRTRPGERNAAAVRR